MDEYSDYYEEPTLPRSFSTQGQPQCSLLRQQERSGQPHLNGSHRCPPPACPPPNPSAPFHRQSSPPCGSATAPPAECRPHHPMAPSPNRPPPDSSMSLLLSSASGTSAYASSSLLRAHRIPPHPPPLFSCPPPPPRRRDWTGNGSGGGRREQKKRKPTRRRCSRCMLGTLLALSVAALLPLVVFLIVLLSGHHSPRQPPAASASPAHPPHHPASDYRVLIGSSSSPSPLPDELPLGRPLHFSLPARHLLYSQLTLRSDSLLLLNFTLHNPNARIVLFARQSLHPTVGEHDWQKIVAGERLHGRRDNDNREALVSHFLPAGRWHLGLMNDREKPESVELVMGLADEGSAGVPPDGAPSCQFDCFGKGVCRDGNCACHPGYGGRFCEETTCPVLCSGNGVFDAGKCHCHQGFKGGECELLAEWCADPICGGHGQCTSEGSCSCETGWTGESCRERACQRNCSGRGICANGKCFCEPGWWGEGCDRRVGEQPSGGEPPRLRCADCSGRGVCREGKCQCEGGWTGEKCERRQCPFGCEMHGKCTPRGECQCAPGWTGTNCQIESCAHNCSTGGQCTLSTDGWRCQCDSAHFGEHCQFARESHCDDGEDNDGDGLADCEDSAECCAHSSCLASPLCLGVFLSRESLRPDPAFSPSTSFFDRFRFLFDGGELSVQRYADLSLFDRSRLSIVRGRILSRLGGPLTGVRVSDANNAQQGFSLSRAELAGGDGEAAGAFELAVNGGAPVRLQFVRQPLGRLLRTFFVPANRLVDVGTVWMGEVQRQNNTEGPPKTTDECIRAIGRLQSLPLLLPSHHSALSSSTSKPSAQLALDTRVVSVTVPVPSSDDQFLLYSSDRADATKSHLRIQLLPEEVPPGVLRVELEVRIAGTTQRKEFSPRPLLSYDFAWDRRNALWQREFGVHQGEVSIGVHLSQCASAVWQRVPFRLAASPLPPAGPSSPLWSLSSVHRLHPDQLLLQRGDGQPVELSEPDTLVLRTVLGNGRKREQQCAECVGKRERSSGAQLFDPLALAAAPDGSAYVGDGNLIRRLSADGSLDTLLQLDQTDSSHPYFLAVDPFSVTLFISLPLKRQIWRLADVNLPEVVVHERELTFPKGIAFDSDGNLLVLDGRMLRIAERAESGQLELRTLVGQRAWRPLSGCARIAPIGELSLEWPVALSSDPHSNHIFVLDSSAIFRLDLRLGVAVVVAGAQKGCQGVTEAPIEAMAFCPLANTLFWTETDGKTVNLIKSLSSATDTPSASSAKTVAGKRGNCKCSGGTTAATAVCASSCHDFDAQSVLAIEAHLPMLGPLAILPNGDLLIADRDNAKLKRMEQPSVEFSEVRQVFVVNSADTDEQFEFDREGRHLRTNGLTSGVTLREISHIGRGGVTVTEGRREWRMEQVGEGSSWRVTDSEGTVHLSAGEGEQVDEQRTAHKIGGPSLSVQLVFGKGDLLESVYAHPDGTTQFAYEAESGLPNWVELPNGVRLKVEGPSLDKNGSWRTRVRGEKSAKDLLVLDEEVGGAIRLFGNDSTAPLLELSRPSHSTSLLTIPALSLQWHFERLPHPHLPVWQRVLMRQRVSTTESDGLPPMRLEWRAHLMRRRHGEAGQQQRTAQLNGRNLFSVDFDRAKLTDVVLDAFENELLRVEYGRDGKAKKVRRPAPNGVGRIILEVEEEDEKRERTMRMRMGRREWTERRNAFGEPMELFVQEEGREEKLFWRKLRWEQDGGGKRIIVSLPSGLNSTWHLNGSRTSLYSPSGQLHSIRSILLPQIGTLTAHLIQQEGGEWRLRRAEETDLDGRTRKVWAGERWSEWERDADGRGTVLARRDWNETLGWRRQLDAVGRTLSVDSALFRCQTQFRGPFPRSANCSLPFLPLLPHFHFNWTGGDQMFRISAIGVQFGATADPVGWTQMEYTKGKLSRMGQNTFAHLPDGMRTIKAGQMFRVELQSNAIDHISHRYFFPASASEPTIEAHFSYSAIGKWTKMDWKSDGMEWTELREMDQNGQVIGQRRNGTDRREWTIGYDQDFRPVKVNGVTVRTGSGGEAVQFGEMPFETEQGTGWTVRRGLSQFQFDAIGQLTVCSSPNGQSEYIYDDWNRMIAWRDSAGVWTSLHYAHPEHRHLLTHFIATGLLWTIHWSEEEQPFLLESSAGHKFAVVVDAEKSIRFLYDQSGQVVRKVSYSPSGEASFAPLKDGAFPPFPLGYRSQLHDYTNNLVFFRTAHSTRPFDPLIGRFISTEIGLFEMEWNRPERIVDAFGLWEGETDLEEELESAMCPLQMQPLFPLERSLPFNFGFFPAGMGLDSMDKLGKEVDTFNRITSMWVGRGNQRQFETIKNDGMDVAAYRGVGTTKISTQKDEVLKELLSELLAEPSTTV